VCGIYEWFKNSKGKLSDVWRWAAEWIPKLRFGGKSRGQLIGNDAEKIRGKCCAWACLRALAKRITGARKRGGGQFIESKGYRCLGYWNGSTADPSYILNWPSCKCTVRYIRVAHIRKRSARRRRLPLASIVYEANAPNAPGLRCSTTPSPHPR
jgi:hypothetical protein